MPPMSPHLARKLQTVMVPDRASQFQQTPSISQIEFDESMRESRKRAIDAILLEHQQEQLKQQHGYAHSVELRKMYDEMWPELLRAAAARDTARIIDLFSPLATLSVMDIAMNGESEKHRIAARTEMFHMAQGKPVARAINLNKNIDGIDEKELDALLRSMLHDRELPQQPSSSTLEIPSSSTSSPTTKLDS